MVLSQIELRSSAAPTTLTSPAEKRDKANKKSTITRYVEGESDSSNEEDTNVVVETEHDDIAIEDVELDGGSEDDDDMSNESEDEEGGHNSFIDDEAEEEFSDEENDDDSE